MTYAEGLAAYTALRRYDTETKRKLRSIDKAATKAWRDLRHLIAMVEDYLGPTVRDPSSELLVAPLMALLGADELESRQISIKLHEGLAAANVVQARAASVLKEWTIPAKKIGHIDKVALAEELGYVWRDITERMPGRKKDQLGTPFCAFVMALTGWKEEPNPSLQINAAIHRMSPTRLRLVASEGYLAYWREGEVSSQK